MTRIFRGIISKLNLSHTSILYYCTLYCVITFEWWSYLVLPFVAFRIKSVISSGCEIYEAWEALTDILVAFIRSANIR